MKSNILKIIFVFGALVLIITCGQTPEEDCIGFSATIVQTSSDQLSVDVPLGSFLYFYKWSNGLGDFPTISVSESGTYKVTVTDLEKECTAVASYEYTKPSGNGCGSFTAVTDAENNLYDIVTIGTQCWMKSNVEIEASIPKITDENEWISMMDPAWCYYGNDVNNGLKYGKLYNWFAVKSGKLCPPGWRIPSVADWEILITHLKNDSLASIAMRKVDILWLGNTHSTNESGFSALPGGRRQANGSFIFEGTEADFWATDESNLAGSAKAITIKGTFDGIVKIDWGKNHGFSCRCIKN